MLEPKNLDAWSQKFVLWLYSLVANPLKCFMDPWEPMDP